MCLSLSGDGDRLHVLRPIYAFVRQTHDSMNPSTRHRRQYRVRVDVNLVTLHVMGLAAAFAVRNTDIPILVLASNVTENVIVIISLVVRNVPSSENKSFGVRIYILALHHTYFECN